MPTLSNNHKEFIVKQLACFEKPSKVADHVKEEFDLEVDRRQVSYYNPETKQGSRQLAKKWKRLHSETRDKFLEGAIDIPIAHKMVRMKELQELYDKFKDMGNYKAAAEILEQAAKEMADAYGPLGDKLAEEMADGQVNFYQQINQKIVQLNQK